MEQNKWKIALLAYNEMEEKIATNNSQEWLMTRKGVRKLIKLLKEGVE